MSRLPLLLSLCFACSSPSATVDAESRDASDIGMKMNEDADVSDAPEVPDGGTMESDAEATADAETMDASPSDAATGALTEAEVRALVEAYKAAHPGNGGKDWDIIACCAGASRTEADLLNDPDAVRLRELCGPDQLPVIPLLAWEYGGADHAWINPEASALVYCIYIPVQPNTASWAYDPAADHVTADVYVLFPDQNPCRDQQNEYQVMACLGDATNIEIIVDTASLHDGADVGLDVSNASTDLYLILPDGTRTHMYTGL